MPLPAPADLAAAPLSVVVFGMGLGESILVRVDAPDRPRWAIVDSARRKHRGVTVNPALETLVQAEANPELVILTHPHLDHTKGMADIVARAAPGAVVACVEPLMDPEEGAATSEDDRMANDAGQTELAHAAMRDAWRNGRADRWPLHCAQQPLALGEWRVQVLHPAQSEADAAAASRQAGGDPNMNNVSAALRIERENVSFVLAGDGETAAWQAVAARMSPDDLLATRPLKIPHHGSKPAIHPVLLDRDQPQEARPQVATPFPQSGRLPRFEPGEGAEQLIECSGLLHLTAMPQDLLPAQRPIAIDDAHAATTPTPFADDDPELVVSPLRPGGSPALVPGRRDPRECWVHFRVDPDGSTEIRHGEHAVHLVPIGSAPVADAVAA